MFQAVARLVARRGITTTAVARRTPTAVVSRSFGGAAAGAEGAKPLGAPATGAPPPPASASGAPASPNLVWLKNAVDQFEHKANLEYHITDTQRQALARTFEANLRSYRDAASEAHRMVGVSTWRIMMVVASFIMTSYHMVREAEHRAAQQAAMAAAAE